MSTMISELITDHNRVGLPGLGTFVAEVVPATFSDKGYTINPPYRRLSFHPSRSEDTLLIDFYAASNGISKEAAGLYLKQFLGEMKSVLKERKTIMLPGLGRLRATVENNFFFVPDPDLDIYPDGFALKPLSLKTISMADEVEIPFFPPMEEEMEVKGAAEVEGESAGAAEAREISENKEETGGPVSPESIQPEQRQSEPTPQPESEQLQPESEPQPQVKQPQSEISHPQPTPQPESGQLQPESEPTSQSVQRQSEPTLPPEQPQPAPQPESEQLQPESEPALQPEQQPGPGEQEPQPESEQSQPQPAPQPQAEQPQPESEQLQPESGPALQPEQQPEPGKQEPQPQSEISQTQPQPAPQPQSRPEIGPVHAPRRFRWWIPLLVLLAVAAVALLAFLTVAQVAPDFIDSILYTPEELRIINY